MGLTTEVPGCQASSPSTNGRGVHLLETPEAVSAYRESFLSPENLLKKLSGPSRNYLLNQTPATGKTSAVVNCINSDEFFDDFDRVIWIAGRRDLLEETSRKFRPNLHATVYPDLGMALCDGPQQDGRLVELHERGLTRAAEALVCGSCPLRQECPFFNRRRPGYYKGAHVVLITDQLLYLRPSVVSDLGVGPSSLVVLDECKGADTGFVHRFTRADVLAELAAWRRTGLLDGPLPHPVGALLQWLLDDGQPPCPCPLSPTVLSTCAGEVQVAGERDKNFKYVAPLACEYSLSPLWTEGNEFAVALYPSFPCKCLFLGGYLDPGYVSWRYRLEGR